MLVAAIGVHDKDLVALERVASGLEDELLAVCRKVGFGVLSAEGKLADVAKVFFDLRGAGCGGSFLLRRGADKYQNTEQED